MDASFAAMLAQKQRVHLQNLDPNTILSNPPTPAARKINKQLHALAYQEYLYKVLHYLAHSSEFRDAFALGSNAPDTRKLTIVLSAEKGNEHISNLDASKNARDPNESLIFFNPLQRPLNYDMRRFRGRSLSQSRQGLHLAHKVSPGSPARSFAHEFLHFIRDLHDRSGMLADRAKKSRKYTLISEKRLITGPLRIVTDQLGENPQISHYGVYGPAKSVTENTPLLRYAPSLQYGYSPRHLYKQVEEGHTARGIVTGYDAYTNTVGLLTEKGFHWYDAGGLEAHGLLSKAQHAAAHRYPIELKVENGHIDILDKSPGLAQLEHSVKAKLRPARNKAGADLAIRTR